VLDLVLVEHAVGHAQLEIDRYNFDVGDLHGFTPFYAAFRVGHFLKYLALGC
jgi:hypothetical protein